MRIQDKLKAGGSKVIASAMSVVLAVGLAPLPAFAGELQSTNLSTQAEAKSSAGYVICAGWAANEPTPQLLGLNNPQYRDTRGNGSEATDMAKFFADDTMNESVDPYLYNYKNDLTPSVIFGGRSGGPSAALVAYNTSEEAAQNDVWKTLPHIILGTGESAASESSKTFYQTEAYLSDAQRTAMGASSTYKPIGVAYDMSRLDTFVDDMYALATAAENVITTDTSSPYYDANYSTPDMKTRYGDPMEIAKDYERYALGMKGYVLKAISEGQATMKTVALVTGYDASAGSFTIEGENFQNGTAPTNRFLEGVTGVANNYYDTAGGTVTADQLRNNVDLILVGSQSTSTDEGALGGLTTAGLLDKTFYCTSWTAGATFTMTANSTENAQNVGRILPCLYPELLDQSDMIAYYYDTFYHIIDSQIATTIADNMDGVRNWSKTDSAAYTAWEASDVAGYNHDTVENLLKTGTNYLANLKSDNNYLSLAVDGKGNTYLADDAAATSFQTITASDVTKTLGDAAFNIGATTNGGGTLSYASSDENVATIDANGLVTLKAVGTTTITITASATPTYGKAVKTVTLTVNAAPAAVEASATTATGIEVGSTATDVSAGSSTTVSVKATGTDTVTVTSGTVKSGGTASINTVEVNGVTYKVTAISASAFKGTSAKKVTVGNNVTTIGKGAFQNAKKLTTVTLGKNVKSIGKNAFKGDTKLKKVTVKSSKLTKTSFKNMVKGSKIKTVKLSGVSKAAKKNYKKWAKTYGVTVK